MVLRRSPESGLLESDREREYRVVNSLEDTAVPVPKTYGFCADASGLERPFFIMERKQGFITPSFQRFGGGNEALRKRMAREVVKTLAAIHNVDWRARGLEFLGIPDEGTGHAASQVQEWKSVLDKAQLVPEPVLTIAVQWLEENLPTRSHTCLLHGDYKMDNILYGEDRVEAILDWEMAGLGDPMQDVGWFWMKYYEVDGLLNGIVEEEEFLHLYEGFSGIPVCRDSVHFWQVLSNVKMAAITLTGVRGFCEGRITSNIMAFLGLLLPRLLMDITRLLEF
jgi:aminoglycoside phosphotransferase (APT) family kinase protein